MIERRLRELIHNEIDGENSPQEKKELREKIRKNPEAKRLYEELKKTADWLDQVPEVQTPAGLKKRIMAGIYRKSEEGVFMARKPKNSKTGPVPRMVFTFALGSVCTLAIIAILNIRLLAPGLDWQEFRGTIGTSGSEPPQTVFFEGAIEGSMTSTRAQDRIRLEIRINRSEPYGLEMIFDPEEICFEGVRGLDGNPIRIENSGDKIRIAYERDGHALLSFRLLKEDPRPIAYRVFHADNILNEGVMPMVPPVQKFKR